MSPSTGERDLLRLLRRLASRAPERQDAAEENGPVGAAAGDALARGLAVRDADGMLALTEVGRAHLKRHLCETDGFAAQHQTRGEVPFLDGETGIHRATVNHDESPLAWLRRQKATGGKPWINAAEFAAGERLRSDYSRAQMLPRVTANWSAAVAGNRRDGSAGRGVEFTEAAIAARCRVDRALTAIGPEFAGTLVDFCCFLKGIAEIERERQWPARSAKLVVRLALAALARHYGLTAQAAGTGETGRLRHWGSEDYRPRLDAG